MSIVIEKNRVQMKAADDPKDSCVGCFYNKEDESCPTIKKGAWTALFCEIHGAMNFKEA